MNIEKLLYSPNQYLHSMWRHLSMTHLYSRLQTLLIYPSWTNSLAVGLSGLGGCMGEYNRVRVNE